MQLHFLGTGSAFNPLMGNNGAYFARGKDLYLLDCGETAFYLLMRAGLLEEYTGSLTVALTHTHADHCGSLGTLALYAAERLGRPLTIVHPHEQAKTLLALMGVRDTQYRMLPALDEKGIKITPRGIRHIAMTAYAFLLNDGEETIYYSGDSAVLPEDIIEGVRSGHVARVYQDVSFYDGPAPENPPHLPFSTLLDAVEPALRGRFVIMHMNRDFRADAAAHGFAYAERGPFLIVR